jgi:hypothetical protein
MGKAMQSAYLRADFVAPLVIALRRWWTTDGR